MVNNKTYNNVVNTLLLMAEKHYGIQTTSVGDIWEIDLEKNTKFPLLHINPTSVTTGDATLTYNFQIFIMSMTTQESDWTENRESAGRNEATSFDKLYKPLSNDQTVYSETLQVATDFISMLRHSKQQSMYSNDGVPYGSNTIDNPLYFTQGQFTIEPFAERFDNLCVGWVFNIDILVQNDFNSCGVPNPQSKASGY
jgi:hypothetical protein